jgi:hypothetical protein
VPEPIAALDPLLAEPFALLLIIVLAAPLVSLAIVPLTALLSGLVDVSGDCCLVVPLALIPLSTFVDVEFCARAAPEVARPKPRNAENSKRDMVQSPEIYKDEWLATIHALLRRRPGKSFETFSMKLW